MRIVTTTPNGLTKTGVVTTVRELKALSQRANETGWPRDPDLITNEHLISAGLDARVSEEVPMPVVAEFGEQAVADDERRAGGDWRQTWTIVTTVTLAEAKAACGQLAIDIYWRKVVTEPPTIADLTAANADPAAVLSARVARLRPTLASVRTSIQNATTVAECWDLYKQLSAVE